MALEKYKIKVFRSKFACDEYPFAARVTLHRGRGRKILEIFNSDKNRVRYSTRQIARKYAKEEIEWRLND